jgi:hypothetical protein
MGALLFCSLAIFGLFFTLNSTTLNPGFISTELNKLDISSLAEEVLSEDTIQGEMTQEFKASLIDTITEIEPLVKEQLSAATYPVYDYLKGKTESLDLSVVLGDTLLQPGFLSQKKRCFWLRKHCSAH